MTNGLPREIERVLVSERELAAAVEALAVELRRDFGDRNPVLVVALTGAVVFLADLMRRLDFPLTVDSVAVSSYEDGAESSGQLVWRKGPSVDLAGRAVVIVEDIVDTGLTLARLRTALAELGATDVATAVLLNKPARRQVAVPVEYVGLDIEDEFVVGYGLDYAQRFRNLPYVGVLRREVYA
jgi:hypoxanthine phosphoribosyltransferase